MKKTLLAAGLSLASASLMAAGTSLETDAEKFSYAVGLNFAQSMMRQGAPLDADAVYMALKDALSGSEPRLSAEVMQSALKSAAQAAGGKKKEMAVKNMEAGKAYMAKNKSKKGVTTLPDGLQYEVLREGTGAQPTADSTVKVHYTGKLIDGREFDSSRREGQPVTFPVNGVIPGWQKILPLMKTGARWQVTIPPDLAYGVEGAGAAIGPNETLVFEIELLEVVK
ncbi:MAG: FKBP-type peptidyl-prolyl cis-trans isomerase [Gammaproteobacteria bacterium]|jgi:FKBP-type peptidyl-prolyl cis-trans isomerase FklB|nr:FKBP-type peptidyl-prolyl cis-trans isomerase [Gammaproteobacteria bacterium]